MTSVVNPTNTPPRLLDHTRTALNEAEKSLLNHKFKLTEQHNHQAVFPDWRLQVLCQFRRTPGRMQPIFDNLIW
jgi:hypothetical protein